MRAIARLSGLFLGGILFCGSVFAESQPDTTQFQLKDIQQRLDQFVASADETELKAEIIILYKLAIGHLRTTEKLEEIAQGYLNLLETAPQKTLEIQEILALDSKDFTAKLNLDSSPSDSLQSLEHQLNKIKVQLAAVETALEEQVDQLQTEKRQPERWQELMADAQQKHQQASLDLEQLDSSNEPPLLIEAKRLTIIGLKKENTARMQQIDQAILSHGARSKLLQVRKELSERKRKVLQNRLSTFEEAINRLHEHEATRVQEAAKLAQRELVGKHQILQQNAKINTELGQELSRVVAAIERVSQDHKQLLDELTILERSFNNTQLQLEVAGSGTALGELLRSKRDLIPDIKKHKQYSKQIDRKIVVARLALLKTGEDRRGASNTDQLLQQLMSTVDEALGSHTYDSIKRLLTEVITDRKSVLDKLSTARENHTLALTELKRDQNRLLNQSKAFSALLKESLFWVASHEPINLGWLKQLWRSLTDLISPTNWITGGISLIKRLAEAPFIPFLGFLCAAIIFFLRRRINSYLPTLATQIGKVKHDSLMVTAEAMTLTFFAQIPVPLILFITGWVMKNDPNNTAISEGLGHGLTSTALFLYLATIFRSLSEPDGIMDRHFNWPEAGRTPLWRHFRWFIPSMAPLVLIIGFTEGQDIEIYRDTVGRLSQMVSSAFLAIFIWQTMSPRDGLMSIFYSKQDVQNNGRLRHFYFSALIILPLILAILSITGYYYTSLNLENRFGYTVLVISGVILVHALLIRWLLVTERRLVYQRALAKREALIAVLKAEKSGEDQVEPPADIPEVLQVNLETINEQTRRILLIGTGITLIIGLWMVWSDLLPAFAGLERVTLWQRTDLVSGVESLVPVTLFDLSLALVIALVTLSAAKNLPGLLEIFVLQSTTRSAGIRFAVSTLSRYAIVSVGFVISFSYLGIGWQEVQWLVAALGVGLGFGLREIFASYVAGIIILFERSVRVGDVVTVGSISGKVTKIYLRATTITDWDNKELVVPNNLVVTQNLTNWTLSDEVTRVIIKISIAKGSNTDQVHRLMHEVARANSSVLETPPPVVLFLGIGDAGYEFELRVFTRDSNNRQELTHQLYMALEKQLMSKGIGIGRPSMDILMKEQKHPQGLA